MTEVTDAFWLQCLQGLKVFTRDIRSRIVSYEIRYFPQSDDEGLEQLSETDDVLLAIKEDRPFATNRAGEEITLKELYKEALPILNAKLADHIDEAEGGFNSQELIEVDCECDAMFEPNDIAVETVRGTRYIQVIIFGIAYEIRNELLPALKSMQYTDENRQVIDSFSMTADSNNTTKIHMKFGWDHSGP